MKSFASARGYGVKTATFASLASITLLAGCFGSTSQLSSMTGATSAFAGVVDASATQPTATDLSKSCAALKTDLDVTYARIEEINKAERARETRQNLASGALNTGLSLLGAGAIANAGSAQAISNIGTATSLAGTAANSAVGAGGPDQKTINQATALAQKSARLEKARVEKGC